MIEEIELEGILEEVGDNRVVSFNDGNGDVIEDRDVAKLVNTATRLKIKNNGTLEDFDFPGIIRKELKGHKVQIYFKDGNDKIYYLRDLETKREYPGLMP